ncbi:MAG: 16S rRNA (cytosine(1402)-N(4))-methyltransferase RsmH [Verrucomicrobia bacterium]|nr:16S rRNA (cytosine(1402)-N(4))-methyltransferase RsmH [Verrucomicrobiota bacterium]
MDAYCHQPVLLPEVLAGLQPRAGGRYVDGTVGGGGHAAAILAASSPDGWLYGCDCDGAAMAAAQRRLAAYSGRYELRQGNYAELGAWVEAGSCDGVLLDLGASSHQFDTAERGFSLQRPGRLDMRFDRGSGRTAWELVNEAPVEELARIFLEFGEERRAWAVARRVVQERARQPIAGTVELAELVARVVGRGSGRVHPATRVFQALRMAVNDELGSLARGLVGVWGLLRRGGRLCVVSFHSGEDRLVKQFGQGLGRDYEVPAGVDVPELRRPRPPELRWVTRKPVTAGAAETAANPRARSARLRVMEKL